VSTPAREQPWTFIIEPLPHEVPAANRVRSALKILLRRFGLKCTALIGTPPETPKTTHQPAQAASGSAETTTTQEESPR
jgi:hypothetical protein